LYSEGFNPHPYITFAAPLSLGFESLCESVDFRLTAEVDYDVIRDRLNQYLPEGIEVYRVAAPVMEPNDIAFALYDIRFYGRNPGQLLALLQKFLDRKRSVLPKRPKRGRINIIDIKPCIFDAQLAAGDGFVRLSARFCAGNQTNINPTLMTQAFTESCPEPVGAD
jgi:radical SAM-linked protein